MGNTFYNHNGVAKYSKRTGKVIRSCYMNRGLTSNELKSLLGSSNIPTNEEERRAYIKSLN